MSEKWASDLMRLNKSFIIDLSGALEDENGKKDIDKIDKLLNLFAKV